MELVKCEMEFLDAVGCVIGYSTAAGEWTTDLQSKQDATPVDDFATGRYADMQTLNEFLNAKAEYLVAVVSYMMGQYPKAVNALNAELFNVRMNEEIDSARASLDADARMALPTTMAYKVLEDFVYESPSGTVMRDALSILVRLEGGSTPQRQRPRVCDEAQASVEAVMRFLPVEKHDLVNYRVHRELLDSANSLAYFYLRDEADCRVARTAYFAALCWNDWRTDETRAWMAKFWRG